MTPHPSPHVLVVDDEHFILNALRLYFESNGYHVSTAAGGSRALEIFTGGAEGDEPVDVVILDLVMPGTHGLDLLRSFKRLDPDVEVIIATGCGSMGSAVEALRLGAFDFITKPIVDFERDLMRSVLKALERRRQRQREVEDLQTVERLRDGHPLLSCPWNQICQHLNDFAARYVGKPLEARALQAGWRVLADGFHADAAILVERAQRPGTTAEPSAPSAWRTLYSWGFATTVKVPEEGIDELRAPLASGTPGSCSVEICSPDSVFNRPGAFPAVSAPADGDSPSTWQRVLQLPLPGDEGSPQRRLLVFFARPRMQIGAIDPTTGPLALLTTVLSRVFGLPLEVTDAVSCHAPEETVESTAG